jgi:hypothetical protein
MLHALPVPADVGTFTLSDRTEVRVRDPDPTTNQAALDLATLVDARAVMAFRHAVYTLAYMPTLTFVDVNSFALTQPALINNVLASAEWQEGRALIGVRELAGYGLYTLASTTFPAAGAPVATGPTGLPPAVPNAQLPPSVDSLLYGSSNTSVSSTLALRPWTVAATVGYQLQGGLNSAAQSALPFQQGPYAQGLADLRADRRNHLVTVVNGQDTSFTSPIVNTEVLLIQAQEEWRHAWTRTTDTMLAAGASEARTRDGAFAPYAFSTEPTAEASFEQRFGHGQNHGSVGLDVRLAPFVNQLLGLVDERVQGAASASWSRRKLTLRATATAAESTDQSSPIASKLVSAEIDAAYAQSQVVSFDVGAREIAYDQTYPSTTTTGAAGPPQYLSYSQTLVFIAVTLRAVKTTF